MGQGPITWSKKRIKITSIYATKIDDKMDQLDMT